PRVLGQAKEQCPVGGQHADDCGDRRIVPVVKQIAGLAGAHEAVVSTAGKHRRATCQCLDDVAAPRITSARWSNQQVGIAQYLLRAADMTVKDDPLAQLLRVDACPQLFQSAMGKDEELAIALWGAIAINAARDVKAAQLRGESNEAIGCARMVKRAQIDDAQGATSGRLLACA